MWLKGRLGGFFVDLIFVLPEPTLDRSPAPAPAELNSRGGEAQPEEALPEPSVKAGRPGQWRDDPHSVGNPSLTAAQLQSAANTPAAHLKREDLKGGETCR